MLSSCFDRMPCFGVAGEYSGRGWDMHLQGNQEVSTSSQFSAVSASSRVSRATALTVLGAVVVADVDLLAVSARSGATGALVQPHGR
jgi:hypothetical protein